MTISEIRKAPTLNATTRTGRVVHGSTRDGYLQCGRYGRRIVYTDRDVNCDQCLALGDETALITVSEFVEGER